MTEVSDGSACGDNPYIQHTSWTCKHSLWSFNRIRFLLVRLSIVDIHATPGADVNVYKTTINSRLLFCKPLSPRSKTSTHRPLFTSMAVHSPELQKQRYAQELVDYTYRQWEQAKLALEHRLTAENNHSPLPSHFPQPIIRQVAPNSKSKFPAANAPPSDHHV